MPAALPAPSATTARRAASSAGPPKPWCWPPAASAAPSRSPATVGNTPATATPWPIDAGAELMDMEFVQFHPTGMVWPHQRARHSGDGRRARRRRRAAQQRRQALHVRRHPRSLQSADRRQRRRRLALHAGRQERPPSARASDARSRGPLHQSRSQSRPRQPAWRRVPGHRLDQAAHSQLGGTHQAQAAQHVPPVQAAGRYRYHQRAHGSRAHHALHDGRSPRRWRYADVHRARPFRGGRSGARACMAPIAWAEIRFPICWYSASAPANTPPISPRTTSGAADRSQARLQAAVDAALAPFDPRSRRRKSLPDPIRVTGHDAGPGRHRAHRKRNAARPSKSSAACANAPTRAGVAGHRQYNNGWHTAHGSRQHADRLRGHHARRAAPQGKPRRAVPRRLPQQRPRVGKIQYRRPARPGRRNDRRADARSHPCRPN